MTLNVCCQMENFINKNLSRPRKLGALTFVKAGGAL